MLDSGTLQDWAQRLLQAEAQRRPLQPMTDALPQITAEDAYAIQEIVIEEKLGLGARVIGYKLALTSQGTRNALGVREPVAGVLLDTALVEVAEGRSHAVLSRGDFIAPQVEPEQAFILGEDLAGPGVTVAQVLAATRLVVPALEIPDSRFNWQVRAPEMMADNAAASRILLGGRGVSPLTADLRLIGVVLEKNGQIAGTAAGAAVLGHPAASVAWLANHLARSGRHLRAGQVIFTGSPMAAVPVEAGDVVRATFDHLGAVEVRFE
ncbi:2-keto-4-pentenoate hydratase [Caldinitratiruptor microaerophilus]|uniref:2-keto-4-pentenoate hydratase n=1 Tax=Caldinitratiruptor microaerophilus TaxID=671077 RepID=A0AA35CMB2_9FIRM|nr:fumarylacetoacetate hydrolase family protein [Caldinitratiruptor microaerophilus]BDG60192.1 2-keto-4-pentenoate hydratase [Caldinitratiruptor microaerophilus]